jgi:hypothetical protein
MLITVIDKKTFESETYELPDDVAEAAQKVYHWMRMQRVPEKVELNGLQLVGRYEGFRGVWQDA